MFEYNSQTSSRGNYGYYWASTASSTSSANYLYFYNSYVGTSSTSKYNGNSVRCVAPIQTTITFDGNGNDGGEMAKQRIIANTVAPLNKNKFTKKSHVFASWNTERDGTGIAYTNGQEYAAKDGTAYVTLYAQWEEVPYMQDVASWETTLDEGKSTEVADKRDGKIYWVSRLADGNIWMTQNLDLDIVAGKTYTSADTDLAYSSIGTTWTPSESTHPSTVSDWDNNSGYNTPSSYDPGDRYWDGNLTTTTNGNTISNGTVTDPYSTSGGNHYHIGNYYNWTAAVAMNDSKPYTTKEQDVNQSICPAGWRLPTYSGDKSYYGLVGAQGLTAGTSGNIQNAPTYFVYGGTWYGRSANVGRLGLYWYGVVNDSSHSYYLHFSTDGYLHPQSNDMRVYGNFVRCVAR